MEYYTLEICGLKRNLPVVYLGPKLRIASLSLLGDVELVEKSSEALLKLIKDIKFDYLVGPEVKVVPLLHAMSSILGKKNYIVCRKAIKGYMINPIVSQHKGSPKLRSLVIDGQDRDLINGKKVVIVDDVVTTGNTLQAVEELMNKAGARVVASCAVLKQGDIEVPSLLFLSKLPMFKG